MIVLTQYRKEKNMGYYTRHMLSIKGDSNNQIQNEIQEYIDANDDLAWALGEGFGEFGESTKWYDHEKDMRKLSSLYPNVIFILEGEGEESGDVWKEYYRNGKMQKCQAKLVFDEYDENHLT